MTGTKKVEVTPAIKNQIAQFCMANNTGQVLNYGMVKAAAEKFNVCKRTVQRIWAAARLQISTGQAVHLTSNKLGKPQSKTVFFDKDRMKAIPFEKRTTIRKLARELDISKSHVGRWVKSKVIRPHTNAIKPQLTHKNKLQRIEFSLSHLVVQPQSKNIKFSEMSNIVHIDEKWFYMSRNTERYYMVPEEIEPHRTCQSKRFIPKVMFMCAVCRPRISQEGVVEFDGKIGIWPFTKLETCQSKRFIPKVMFMCAVCRPRISQEGVVEFDGKIGIWPFTKLEAAQRSSRNRMRGTMITKPIESITKEVIKECILNQIIPAIKAKWPAGESKHIFIQQDNARPHILNDDPDFRVAATTDGFNIQLLCQPPNSPDMNINDLGWFRAIQSLQVDTASYNVDQLVMNVLLSFEQLTSTTLNNVFLSLQACLIEVLKVNGHNNYKLPHMGKTKLIREGRLPSSLPVDKSLIVQAIQFMIEYGNTEVWSYDLETLLTSLEY